MADHSMPLYNIVTDPVIQKKHPDKNVHGQHWTTVRELWMQKDKEQCEIWKDEVQNVLIFSGLFSAIVTAFLIQSQTDLLPDPAQESVQLLRQIAAQSAGKEWVAEADPGIGAISIVVNVFWFLSLVLSLTTALVGIVSLQWIRSHIRSLSDGPDSLGLAYMHSLGLHQSYIPHVFTYLPVILIFGLAFFLSGLGVFLFKLSWQVAIPVIFAISCTFLFLVITTIHPWCQSDPVLHPSDHPKCYPSPYRSPQSLIFISKQDWISKSKVWLQQRTKDFFSNTKVAGHLEQANEKLSVSDAFAYDTVKALISVKKSRAAESEKEKMALAQCLAEVLPIHLSLFLQGDSTGDLVDIIPFLPHSAYVPCEIFLRESVSQDHLNAVALLQVSCLKGLPCQSADLVKACIRATNWLFQRPRELDTVPEKQPLHLISKPASLSTDALEALIETLASFFSYAAEYQPEEHGHAIRATTYTSSYTYWFLTLSAKIIASCSLSSEILARHTYILSRITSCFGERKNCDYLFYVTSIYASNITASAAITSSVFWNEFLHSVMHYRSTLMQEKPENLKLPLPRALKAGEIVWSNFNRALAALGPAGPASSSDSPGGDGTAGSSHYSAQDQDNVGSKRHNYDDRMGDAGEAPSWISNENFH
ncbi:hypothetical protein CVT25_014705 [Psilocybe cyanescens]|uniref:DUF6535 domain-containing protein n=1 Tax=Psilocybe cyanescens TaxID=93625 RepID=A0A409WR18_PSICY|nr:hypothetical protein CVT25_014705 [Psilocybe cyanescens]